MILRSLALAGALLATSPLVLAQDTQGLSFFGRLAVTMASTAASTQDDAPKKPVRAKDVEKIDTFIRHARTGSAVIRPQAAQRLVRIGEPAAKRLLELSGDSTEELALMGTALVEVLGQFDEPALRGKLWPAMENGDFPWRPAAARSLAWAPTPGEWDRFTGYLEDPIAPVRHAVLDALFRISQLEGEGKEEKALQASRKRAFLDLAVAALHDENDMVRRRAAVLLDARGHGSALNWIVEELERVDTFFDRPTGLTARYDAMNMLMERGIDLGDYVPELPSAAPKGKRSNAKALAKIREEVANRTDLMNARLPKDLRGLVPAELPPVARAGARVGGALIGLELKSCRKGEFYLRWTEDDQLVVGYGNPAWIPLPEGTTARLVELSKSTQADVGAKVYWGRPGCDVESYRMPRATGPADFPQQLIVSKDEQPAPGLRPAALSKLGAALAASIPTDAKLTDEDGRTRELARRVRACFASIGGAVGN